MSYKTVNVLIVDDKVVKVDLIKALKLHFEYYLKKDDYNFEVNVINEGIEDAEQLWKYLNDKKKPEPDFIILDWHFKGDNDIDKKDFTGFEILSELTKKKSNAYREENKFIEREINLYKKIEVIVVSGYASTPRSSNIKEMFESGCIAVASMDCYDTEKEKSFLLERIFEWNMNKPRGITCEPKYEKDDVPHQIVEEWHRNRKINEGKTDHSEQIDIDKLFRSDRQRDFFTLIACGTPFSELPKKYTRQDINNLKDEISDKLSRYDGYNDIENSELHRWLYFAIEKKFPFVWEIRNSILKFEK